jgi:hypothetical protein
MPKSAKHSFPEISYPTYSAAVRAFVRLRHEGKLQGMVVKIVESPYGGFRLKKTQADLYVDSLAETRQSTG